MKYVIRLSLCAGIFGLVCLLTSCQSSINLVIVNESGRPVIIKYKAKLANYTPQGSREMPVEFLPKVIDLETWDRDKFSDSDWQTKAAALKSFDFGTGSFVLSIAPNEVVRILKDSDSVMYRGDADAYFPLVSLEVSDDSGREIVYPAGLRSQFSKRGSGNYYLAVN